MKLTNKGWLFLFAALLFITGLSVLFLGRQDKDEGQVTQTGDISLVAADPGVIVQTPQGEATTKDVIIAVLSRTVDELKAKGQVQEKLMAQLQEANRKFKGKLDRFTVLNSETRIENVSAELIPVAPLPEPVTSAPTGTDFKFKFLDAEPTQTLYRATAEEKDGWYKIESEVNLTDDKITHNVWVKNEFEISEFIEGEVRKVEILNRNPYTFTTPGTNVFDLKPVKPEKRSRIKLAVLTGYNLTYIIKEKEFVHGPGIGAGIAITL